MSIRQMLPVGTHLRKCIVCGYPITAKSDALTAHEMQCLDLPMPEEAKLKRTGTGYRGEELRASAAAPMRRK
jgi:hypothetical protein